MKTLTGTPTHKLTIDKREIAIQTISCLLVLLFVYAAGSKLMDYTKFRVEIGKSPLLTAFAAPVAIAVPIIELVIALLLSFTRTRLPGLYASFTLMVLFTAYIFYILRFSPYVPCSCGGVLQKLNWTTHLWFNLFFVLLAALGVLIFPYLEPSKSNKAPCPADSPSSSH
ncbi:MAG TPA: MauE/DoxX family redox-associated membrane protein [Puia sp.]|uniref:MauE/DoxX family redox-associated membrane protein n=1 Tax=Puia sp. TaxID=2045100 RepID=UPI002C46F599|nr:MauE/DoxX family redox-associated membrane protein [Puia sp.]HVU95409.1 MauE/DoxX family redox-associated membrane protein [Puia sp.]